MNKLKHGDMTLTWLPATYGLVDGGPVFGTVPKDQWTQYYPTNADNEVEVHNSPILIQYRHKNYLIDTGSTIEDIDDNDRRHSYQHSGSILIESLAEIGLTPEDIDVIMMTHMHDNHASGLTRIVNGKYVSTFPKAEIYINDNEWGEVTHPNERTKGLYYQENWEPIIGQVQIYTDAITLVPGIEMIHVGGHSRGMSFIKLTQGQDVIMHCSDLLQTVASARTSWITAYDDYPMDSINAKQKWLSEILTGNYKLIFYHDAYYCMLQFSPDGSEIIDSMEREGDRLIPWPAEIPQPSIEL